MGKLKFVAYLSKRQKHQREHDGEKGYDNDVGDWHHG